MADTKLEDLSAVAGLNLTDLFYVVQDPAGTPLGKKAALSLLRTLLFPVAPVSVRLSADLTGFAIGGWRTINHNTEDFDLSGQHDNSVNPSRLIAAATGNYLVIAIADIKNTSVVGSTVCGCRIIANGSTTVVFGLAFTPVSSGAGGAIVAATGIVPLAAGGYVEQQAYCDGSSGTFDVRCGAAVSTRFMMTYLGA